MKINVAQVFVDENGKFGNPVGIVVNDEHKIDDEERQKIATKLDFSEIVFIDSLGTIPEVSIFNPQHKVKFAGHAVLGTVYFINHVLEKSINSIKCGEEMVTIKFDNDVTYISAPLSIMPSWNYKQLDSSNQVEELPKDKISQMEHTFVWAWIDESKGLVRARTFAPDWGIPEDQANGSGSMKLAAQLGKSLKIIHGDGSIIHARPSNTKSVEVGGLVKIIENIKI
jgi:predicted PhzF superfamily epimerase YddE/YHI9